MEKQTAARVLEETFSSSFDPERFSRFIKEMFNKFNISPKSWAVWKEYRDYIDSYQLLGSYRYEKHVLDVLIVKLKRSTSIERARTMQRNFIAKYLGNAEKDAALVAFYEDGSPDWRFSFVKMEYRLKDKAGKVKVEKELTPAKRYSFLVGKNEPNHTCKRQFLQLVVEEERMPSIDDIESAFSIEKVTKEFFNEYKELYLELKESLDKVIERNSRIKKEFEEKGILSVDFSKKLLGQIVFIYFLQKKGWLGVQKSEHGFQPWGSGPKNFLRKLFDKEIVSYSNFFNDVLEPLFYEALATQRDDDYYSRFNCKVPFLNGGLFEPIGNYDWVSTDVLLENRIFERILDTFDRYNFTIKEDEPLEKEVAIDPEMLGKVFENLLEIKDRKSKGSYYTPRKIVHYMCQQSLINYLETNTSIPRDDIEKFIQFGEFTNAEDERHLARIKEINEELSRFPKNTDVLGKELKQHISELTLPSSVIANREKIDLLLRNVKIVDPAVGSGAFPVGMMTEIVKARSVLTPFFQEAERKKRTDYNLKRETIENCLYGVDIDSSAVDIAKLRFWLSLIVDELDMRNIKPLPNLDHKIMVGNSLLEEFEGVKLFDERLLNGKKTERQTSLIELDPKMVKESQKKLNEYKRLQHLLFNEQDKKLKKQYSEQIDNIEWELIEETLKEQNNEYAMKKLNQYKKSRSKPFFLWKLYFAEVFQRENPGFDIVIANPPYLKERDNKEIFRPINESEFGKQYHQGKMDYWFYFLHKAIDIVKIKGIIAYITSRYWLNSSGSKKLIKRIKNQLAFVNFVDIGKLKVFDNVAGQHMVAVYKKDTNVDSFIYKKLSNDLSDIDKSSDTENLVIKQLSNKKVFSENNEILLEDSNIFSQCIHLHEITNTSVGVQESPDRLTQKYVDKSKRSDIYAGQGVFVVSKMELKSLNLTKTENEIVKKYLDPSDISRYRINWNGKYLIYSDKQIREKIKKDPTLKHIKRHLDNLKEFITSSNKPYGLHRPRKIEYFTSPKVIFKGMFRVNEFTYDDNEYFVGFSFSVINQKKKDYDLKYILALLNSKLALDWFYKNGKRRGGGVDIGVEKLRLFPIKKASKKDQHPFIKLVDQILAITKDKDYLENSDKQTKVAKLEKEIDQLVYKLYE